MSTQSSASTPAVPFPSARTGWTALPVVLAGTFMVILDFFIVNVALPSMQADLHAGSGAIQWVVAGYALTSAIFLILAGRLGDRFGRRRVLCAGLALFTLASAEAGLAGSTGALVGSRLLQGVAAAAIMPNVLSIIGVNFDGADRARALGLYGLVMGLAAVSGQLIGGGLVQADVAGLGWRACFLINVPVGVLALAFAPRLVPESRGERTPLDLRGTALVSAAVTALVLPLVQGQQQGWPLWTWLAIAGSPVLLAGFAVQQRRLARSGGKPLIAPELFAERSFAAGLVAQLTFWCGQASFFLVLALYLQQGRGLSAIDAGLVFTILAVAYVATSARAPELSARYGRALITTGALLLAAGDVLLLAAVEHVGVGGPVALLAPGLALVGAGMGLVIVPLTTTIMSGLRPEQAGSATGVLATVQNIGNALGVAVIGAVFFGALHRGYADAFELSLALLIALLAGVALLARLLPRGAMVTD